MAACKSQVTLKLIETFVDKCEDLSLVTGSLVPAMMDPILGDYARNVPDARCASSLLHMDSQSAQCVLSCDVVYELVHDCRMTAAFMERCGHCNLIQRCWLMPCCFSSLEHSVILSCHFWPALFSSQAVILDISPRAHSPDVPPEILLLGYLSLGKCP